MSQTIHRKKFDNGRRTPQEYHREFAFPPTARCAACSRRPAIRAVVLCPFDEAQKRNMLPEGALFNPNIMQLIVQVNEGGRPKPYIRVSMTYCCDLHRKEMSKALAKTPSWCIVEINEGPDPTNKVQVGAG